MNFETAIALTLAEVEDQQAETSQHTYRWAARNLAKQWGNESSLTDIGRAQVQAWCNQRRNEVKPASLIWELSFMRRVYRVAEENGLEVDPPFQRLRLPKLGRTNWRYRVMSEDPEETALRATMDAHSWSIAEFAVHTGMRRLEIFRLKPHNVRLWTIGEERGITIRKGFAEIETSKTGEKALAALNPIAAAIAHRWLQDVSGEYLIWNRPRCTNRETVATQYYCKEWLKACRACGILDLHFHDLRHTCATRAILRGARVQDVQQLLRHKTISQTERYILWTAEHQWPAAMALCSQYSGNGNKEH